MMHGPSTTLELTAAVGSMITRPSSVTLSMHGLEARVLLVQHEPVELQPMAA